MDGDRNQVQLQLGDLAVHQQQRTGLIVPAGTADASSWLAGGWLAGCTYIQNPFFALLSLDLFGSWSCAGFDFYDELLLTTTSHGHIVHLSQPKSCAFAFRQQ